MQQHEQTHIKIGGLNVHLPPSPFFFGGGGGSEQKTRWFETTTKDFVRQGLVGLG